MPKDQQQWDMEAWSAGPAQETGDSKEQKELNKIKVGADLCSSLAVLGRIHFLSFSTF